MGQSSLNVVSSLVLRSLSCFTIICDEMRFILQYIIYLILVDHSGFVDFFDFLGNYRCYCWNRS